MKTLDSLKFLGYNVEVKDENIKLSYRGEGKPDKNRVLQLIKELEGSKNEAIKELQDETLRGLFMETMNRVNDSYISGTIKFIEENYPDIDGEIIVGFDVEKLEIAIEKAKANEANSQ